LNLFNFIDYLGTFVFAVTGASIGGNSRFDFFGMLFLAFLTAVGGGTVRDLIISESVFWTLNPIYLYIILLGTISTFFMLNFYEKQKSVLLFLDTLGLGFFVVVGTQKTIMLGFNSETALIMGTISAVLGGILRSAFSGEESILYQKELYATVAAMSSLLFIFLTSLGLEWVYCAAASILVAFVTRYSAIKFGIKLPALNKSD